MWVFFSYFLFYYKLWSSRAGYHLVLCLGHFNECLRPFFLTVLFILRKVSRVYAAERPTSPPQLSQSRIWVWRHFVLCIGHAKHFLYIFFFLFQILLSKVARVFAAYRDFATGRLRVVPWVGRQVVLPVERVAQYGAAAVVDVACALPWLLLLPAVVPARGDTEVVSGRNHSWKERKINPFPWYLSLHAQVKSALYSHLFCGVVLLTQCKYNHQTRRLVPLMLCQQVCGIIRPIFSNG